MNQALKGKCKLIWLELFLKDTMMAQYSLILWGQMKWSQNFTFPKERII